jgi:hypothetical protein
MAAANSGSVGRGKIIKQTIKLPDQVWLGYDSEHGDIHGYTFEQMREFAELIIEECIAQCWTVSESESKGFVVSECSKRIRKHFGILDA